MNAPEIWTAREIASLLGLSERHVSERVVHEKGFPVPIRNGKYVRRRWLAEDIITWMKRQNFAE